MTWGASEIKGGAATAVKIRIGGEQIMIQKNRLWYKQLINPATRRACHEVQGAVLD